MCVPLLNICLRIIRKETGTLYSISHRFLFTNYFDIFYEEYVINVFRIKKIVFIEAAEEIVKAYPNEKSSIYFIPAKPKTKHSQKTYHDGKLWHRYKNVQKSLGGYDDIENDIHINKLGKIYYSTILKKIMKKSLKINIKNKCRSSGYI